MCITQFGLMKYQAFSLFGRGEKNGLPYNWSPKTDHQQLIPENWSPTTDPYDLSKREPSIIPYSLLDNAWGSIVGDQLSEISCQGSVVGQPRMMCHDSFLVYSEKRDSRKVMHAERLIKALYTEKV